MPANKDEKRGTWIAQFYYTDWTGARKKKKKRGFATKREALEWERDFLQMQTASVNMSLSAFSNLYLEDMSHRLRKSTMVNKRALFDLKIKPYLGSKPLNEITAADIRKWQNELIGEGYAPTYLKIVNNQLTALFNYAVKYYSLTENPCKKAGSMGKNKAEEMQFWTKDEYSRFAEALTEEPRFFAAFETLDYTGMRVGELTALYKSDIDIKAGVIRVNKSYQLIEGEDVITEPKTTKSKRTITIPQFLCAELEDYISRIYGLADDDRVFQLTRNVLEYAMQQACDKSGVKKIRIHDLRHSHASLLIEMGFSPVLIAERLGHESVETTLNTYAHLYPSKQEEVAQKLEEMR